MKVHKIRRSDGKFMNKRGAYNPWDDAGDCYRTPQACKTAIKTRWRSWEAYNDGLGEVEIIEYELVETGERIVVHDKGKKEV